MTQKICYARLTPLALAALLGLGGCNFDVDNPGRVLEDDLNTVDAVNALVIGMSSDFSEEYDGIAFLIARASDEMAGSGSYNTTNNFRRGIIEADQVDGVWEGIQRARWVAEDGIRRLRDDIEGYVFAGNALTAKAYIFAGLANRVIGESFCFGTMSAGAELGGEAEAAQPNSEAFQRALNMLAEAVTHAQGAGSSTLEEIAHGGRAQAYVGLGDWTNAVIEAGMVSTDFVFEALYDDNSGRENNEMRNETNRREMSAFDTYAASFSPEDPRAPYTDCPTTGDCNGVLGADGITPFWRQDKYWPDRGADIPAVKGTEMRLIEAEAELRNNNLGPAITFMNEVRTFHGLADLTPAPADIAEAFIALDRERYLTLWLEGRRMHDTRRWMAEGRTTMPSVRFANGLDVIAGDNLATGITQRAVCIPLSFSECLSNPNLRGAAECTS